MNFSTFFFAAALAVSGSIASAGTISFSIDAASTQGAGNDADQYAGNFDGTTPLGASWFNGAFAPLGNGTLTAASAPLVTPPPGNVSGAYQSPFNNTPLKDKQSYFSIGGSNNGNGGGSPMTLEFAAGITEFSFLWGSIDSYNEIEFFDAAQTSLGFLTGTGINSFIDPTGTGPNFENVALLSIFAAPGDAIKYIAFSSTTAALEIAFENPAAIPLPASGLLLIGALGGLYGARRRRKA